MWCCKCDHDLSECTCPDINDRLRAAADSGLFVYKRCRKCGEHYDRCHCPQPEWELAGAEARPLPNAGPSRN